MMHPARRILLAAALLLVAGTARSAEPSSPSPGPDSGEATYLEAERAYLKSDSQTALRLLAGMLSREAEIPARSLVRARNLRGLIHFQGRNLQGAVQDFEAAAQSASRSLQNTDSLLHLARYNLGNALFQLGRAQDALDTLAGVNHEALDSDTRTRYHHLYGNVLASRDQPLEALVQYLHAASSARDLGARETFLQKAISASRKIYLANPKADLERIQSLSFDPRSSAGLVAQVLLARGYMHAGDLPRAESLLKGVVSQEGLSPPLRGKAEEMLSDIARLAEVEPRTIGVLLPLSGKFGRFGRLCLNSILFALGAFEEMPEPASGGSGIRLAIRDSGETPESAQERFEQLVKDEKAIAVIGPLLSKQFPQVAQRAQEYGVPLLSLSQRVDAGRSGSFVFPVALSPAQQIDMIVDRAIGVNGFRRFAILAPSDSFGDAYVNLFWDAVEKAGAEVVDIERYEPKSTDFRDEMRRLLGLEHPGARRLETEELERRKAQYAATLKVKGRLRQRLLHAFDPKAIVDFDAVFVPDDPATIGQIAPSFAVYDVDNIPLLGINTWNTPEIVQRAGRYLQRSLFVDGFFAGTKNPGAAEFMQDYMRYFQSVPGTIEVQAFDAAKILMEALGAESPAGRAQLRDRLLGTEKFSGISGDYHFTETGVQRTAHLLTVKGSSISEVPVAR